MKVVTELIAGTRCHLTVGQDEKAVITLFLAPEQPSSTEPVMGTLVYGIPRRDQMAITSRLFTDERTLDTAEQIARLLAKKLQHPVLIGCSSSEFISLPAIYNFVREELSN